MAEIIQFPNLDDIAIEIERTEEFKQAAKELGDYIALLPLNHEQNDELIRLMVEQVNTAEQGAFLQAFKMGFDLGKG